MIPNRLFQCHHWKRPKKHAKGSRPKKSSVDKQGCVNPSKLVSISILNRVMRIQVPVSVASNGALSGPCSWRKRRRWVCCNKRDKELLPKTGGGRGAIHQQSCGWTCGWTCGRRPQATQATQATAVDSRFILHCSRIAGQYVGISGRVPRRCAILKHGWYTLQSAQAKRHRGTLLTLRNR